MATGACGINCDVCGLKAKGVCPGCKPGNQWESQAVENHPCPVLKCAVTKQVAHCLKDCGDFPCQIIGNFPFSSNYIGMHKSRASAGK